MKRKQAEYPYNDFWIYKIWHEKEGRWQANLICKNDTSKRTTISYAKYVLSVHLERLIDQENEHVDHVNNDCSDDRVENLQILTPQENKEKYDKFYRENTPKMITLECSTCSKGFEYVERNYRFHKKNGRTRFHCCRKCAHASLRKK